MSQPKMLFISQEATPYLPESPLADLSTLLPRKAQEAGYEVRLFLPKYGNINERRNQLHEVIRLSGMNIVIDDTDHPLVIKVATMQSTRMQVYFIDNDDYFERHPSPELETVSHADENGERTVFFVRGVAETVKKLRWDPVVINCTGWLTALTPAYLKRVYNDDPVFRKTKIVYTLTNQSNVPAEPLDPQTYKQLKTDGITDRYLASVKNKPIDFDSLNRLAIDHADAIIIGHADVSPELIEYAMASGKPVLPFACDLEQNGKALADFYDQILNPAK
ncbi:MAG: glycogen/starch synthase [Muribaculaceae bacterium]|nr:glycogen/starch synthase [Muribaculaceae bacterium]MDE6165734.1 glycogen/starch synthase [Muribaculaceae bacterium]